MLRFRQIRGNSIEVVFEALDQVDSVEEDENFRFYFVSVTVQFLENLMHDQFERFMMSPLHHYSVVRDPL